MWWRRSDGDLVRDLPRNRRVMPYLMRGRNEAAVYFEHDIPLRKADALLGWTLCADLIDSVLGTQARRSA